MCRLSWNLGASASWNPQGLSRPVQGLLYLYNRMKLDPIPSQKNTTLSLFVIKAHFDTIFSVLIFSKLSLPSSFPIRNTVRKRFLNACCLSRPLQVTLKITLIILCEGANHGPVPYMNNPLDLTVTSFHLRPNIFDNIVFSNILKTRYISTCKSKSYVH